MINDYKINSKAIASRIKILNILNIFMGKLFKQNFLYLFVRRTIYSGESQFKTSTIFEATVFNAAISLLYS